MCSQQTKLYSFLKTLYWALTLNKEFQRCSPIKQKGTFLLHIEHRRQVREAVKVSVDAPPVGMHLH